MRISCATLLVTLVALAGCTDDPSGSVTAPKPGVTTKGDGLTLGNPSLGDHRSTADRTLDPADDPNGNPGTPLAPGGTNGPSDPPEPVPEPSTILLFGLGLTGLAVYRRRRRDDDKSLQSLA